MSVPKDRGGMGFRDLMCFNKALLEKQCWRLFQSTDSLISRIMKAKYYLESSILETNLGTKTIFAWSSIHGARDLVKDGLINGFRVNLG
jgi:hypothetical protein